MIIDFINKRINLSKEILQASLATNKKIETLSIDATFFNTLYFDHDIRKLEQLKDVFNQLKLIKNPVLYWFEIDETKINAEKIRNLYVEHLAKKSNRAISSYKKDYDIHSKILYVGKVKTGFWGRLITHLGFTKATKQQVCNCTIGTKCMKDYHH